MNKVLCKVCGAVLAEPTDEYLLDWPESSRDHFFDLVLEHGCSQNGNDYVIIEVADKEE